MSGFEIVVFLQPELVLEDQRLLGDADRQLQDITNRHTENPESAGRWRTIRQLIGPIFEKNGIEFRDVATFGRGVSSSEQLYIDYCHLTPTGSKQLAGTMARHLLPGIVEDLSADASISDGKGTQALGSAS